MLKRGVQDFLYEMWEAACYAISIVKLAEEFTGEHIDLLEAVTGAIDRGYIYYNWENPDDDNNFYVNQPAEFLEMLTGKKWEVRKESFSYVPKHGELVIEQWQRQKVGKLITHFRLPSWDSLIDSQTVKFGTVASLRVFK